MKNFTALLIVFILSFVIYLPNALAKKKKKFKGIIIVNQILKLSGTMTKNGEPAPEFSGIKEGDLLETGEKSFAVLRIPGLGVYRMGPQTKLKLTRFANRDRSRFDLLTGSLVSVFKRLGDHAVDLPRAEIIPTGAVFLSSINATDNVDHVVLCSGKVHVKVNGQAKSSSLAPTPPPALTAPTATPVPTIATMPTATPSAEPTATPAEPVGDSFLSEMTLSPDGDRREVHVTSAGILKEKPSEMKGCDARLLEDLESLYALP